LRRQRTIAQVARVAGFGFWSGQDVQVEFRPAPADSGITFVRADLQPVVRIPAHVANRIEVPRRTTLTAHGVAVEMVEHLLAACMGLEIDNCEVWVDSAELPGCDGSSAPFVDALQQVGAVEQENLRPRLTVADATRVGDDDSWVEARPSASAGLSLKYQLDYGSGNDIGRQTIKLEITRESFQSELASARTFLLSDEADWLRSRGLGQRVKWQDVLVFGEDGPIENELRFEDECVRHKALDLLGDLALAGCELVGHFAAYRSGHRLNAELVRVLLTQCQIETERRKSA